VKEPISSSFLSAAVRGIVYDHQNFHGRESFQSVRIFLPNGEVLPLVLGAGLPSEEN